MRRKDFALDARHAFQTLMVRLRGTRTQSQVERDTGVPQSTISMMEKAPSPNMSLIDLGTLCNYYGITPNEAFEVLGLYTPRDRYNALVDTETLEVRNALSTLPPEQRRLVFAAVRGMIAELKKEIPPTEEGQGERVNGRG